MLPRFSLRFCAIALCFGLCTGAFGQDLRKAIQHLDSVGAQARRQRVPTIYDIQLFDGPALPLAKAIKRSRILRLKRLLRAKVVPLNYEESRYHASLLEFAVANRRYRACRALLEAGADPNQQSVFDGESPMMLAAKINTTRYLRLLLAHGGNPKDETRTVGRIGWRTVLASAADHSLANVKLLLAAGADVNQHTRICTSALNAALGSRKLDIVDYLVFTCHANARLPYYIRDNYDTLSAAYPLRSWVFPLDSKEYRFKMQLATYLKTQGIDYWKEPIYPNFYKNYPKEYLEKY